MRFDLMHPADQLVMIMARIYRYGMTTTSGGNLSIRDDNGDIWITPSGIDKGNLTRADMIQVKPDGTLIGIHKPSVELPFHKEIYRVRPDLRAIVHAHPPTLVAFSLARKLPNTHLIPTASEVCGEVTMAKYDVPGSEQLGRNIAEEFAKGYNSVLLENHGVVCGGKNLFGAFMSFETLDTCGRLEIDAAKTGVRPNLDEFLSGRKVKRTPFLQYKYLLERAEERRRAWYEFTHRERLEAFFAGIDWDQVDSPVERLPWLARQLERNTPKIQEKPAKDSELFAFAQKRNWKRQLDQNILSSVSALLWDYEHCLSRIRACRAPAKGQQRKTDIDRILYARGQEEVYDSDELYAFFQQLSPERIAALRKGIVEQQWHLMTEAQRETFLREWLPEGADYYDLLTDFRHGGFRLLGDLVCDMNDLATARERKQLRRPADSPVFQKMMEAYLSAPFSGNERTVVSKVCRKLLDKIVQPSLAAPYVVALGKRNLLWDLLPDHIEEHVLEVDHAE